MALRTEALKRFPHGHIAPRHRQQKGHHNSITASRTCVFVHGSVLGVQSTSQAFLVFQRHQGATTRDGRPGHAKAALHSTQLTAARQISPRGPTQSASSTSTPPPRRRRTVAAARTATGARSPPRRGVGGRPRPPRRAETPRADRAGTPNHGDPEHPTFSAIGRLQYRWQSLTLMFLHCHTGR